MMHQLWQRFFPPKHFYVLVDSSGRDFSHPRRLSAERAEQLNEQIRHKDSDMRWIQADRRMRPEFKCD